MGGPERSHVATAAHDCTDIMIQAPIYLEIGCQALIYLQMRCKAPIYLQMRYEAPIYLQMRCKAPIYSQMRCKLTYLLRPRWPGIIPYYPRMMTTLKM